MSLVLGACASSDGGAGRLALVQQRGELNCGVSGRIPGFSFLESDGSYAGIDVDICRAVAAATLGDGDRVAFRTLTAPERFTALRSGEIDLLSRNTTMNLSRDASGGNGVSFGPVVFHDGQGLMVQAGSGIETIEDLDGATICVGSGTTTEQNLNDSFQSRGLSYTPLKFQEVSQVSAGYLQGRCDAMTSDRSQLAALRSGYADPGEHRILDVVMSKEPLAPATAGGEPSLTDALRWTVYALITAEELGITQANVEARRDAAAADPDQAALRRFLGVDGGLGSKLGLSDDFVVETVKAVGNYGEIYDRHLGPESPVPIPRGQNALASQGGLQSAPPFN
ncbi:amino acid ABC transporter substrate-binding protein [Synechococcus sp. RSCCF101]|nr:amino acid ABC transporter substrate-binding protein [Synechococcus sp. RSCCF101]